MKYIATTIFVLQLVTAGSVCAQTGGPSLVISGNVAIPSGDFGKSIGENPQLTRRSGFDFGDKVGLARTGMGFGAEFLTPIFFTGLDWMLSAQILANGTDVSAIEDVFEAQLGDSIDLQFEYGSWTNIPLMTGFRYGRSIAPNLKAYGSIQIGINITKAASRKAIRPEIDARYRLPDNTYIDTTFYYYPVEKTTFKFSRDFGLEIGLGVELFNRVNIGVRYLALNTPMYRGTRKLSEYQFPGILSRETAILGEARPISMVLISLGYRLF